ncbi:hypothetical protein D3C78_1608090 [compost metagenome]
MYYLVCWNYLIVSLIVGIGCWISFTDVVGNWFLELIKTNTIADVLTITELLISNYRYT